MTMTDRTTMPPAPGESIGDALAREARAALDPVPGELLADAIDEADGLADRLQTMRDERDALTETVARLTAERDTARVERSAEFDRHRADVRNISERLNREADARGYCSEFDDVIRELNRTLAVELAPRSRTYLVTMTVCVTVDDCETDDDARESARMTLETEVDQVRVMSVDRCEVSS